jgi:signal transduction histidine kinase
MSERRESNRPASEAGLGHAIEMGEMVAHEINNLLNNILLNAAVMERKVPDGARAELAAIREAGTRAGRLVNRWQQVLPRKPADLRPVDLNEAAAAAVAAWQNEARPGVTARFEPAADLPAVLADPAMLERLTRVLLTNAAASLPSGTITVRTERGPAGVLLLVEDTGPAIEEAMLERVFEPFVVARPTPSVSDVGDQPDLGLAVCKKLARRQQGTIQAENRAEGGVRVVVQLRQAEAPG